MPIYFLVVHGGAIIQWVPIFIELDGYEKNPKSLIQLLLCVASE